jgi:intracellular multiplication protein IcmP
MAYQSNGGVKGAKAGIGTGVAIMLGAMALFISAFWFIRHDAIVRVFLHYAYAIVFLPAWICGAVGWSGAHPVRLISAIANYSWHPDRVDPWKMFSIINSASMYLLPFTLIPLNYTRLINAHILRNMESLHDYWELMKIQALTNPCIVPVVRFTEYWWEKGVDRHANLFRSLTPDEFAKKHDLLKKTGVNEVLIDHDKAIEVFEAQLSGRLEGPEFSTHYKALACIFMTRILYRGEEGRRKGKEMLDTINQSCDPNKTMGNADADCSAAFDFSGIIIDFDSMMKHETIKLYRTYFVYQKTFLMMLLNEARSDGKLPPSEFIWLKLIDRDLWYALYGVSENLIAKGYAEGGAAFAQYWSSIAAMNHDQYLNEPHMEEAVRGLEKRLFEANIVSERLFMTEKERERELTFGQIPGV